jgi:hypothetical protein
MESPVLTLSTITVPVSRISAIHLDTYALSAACRAVALWIYNVPSPLYFSHGSSDALALRACAERDTFVPVASLRFASAAIRDVLIDGAEVSVFVIGDELPFYVVGADDQALRTWLAWHQAETLPRAAAVTLIS